MTVWVGIGIISIWGLVVTWHIYHILKALETASMAFTAIQPVHEAFMEALEELRYDATVHETRIVLLEQQVGTEVYIEDTPNVH